MRSQESATRRRLATTPGFRRRRSEKLLCGFASQRHPLTPIRFPAAAQRRGCPWGSGDELPQTLSQQSLAATKFVSVPARPGDESRRRPPGAHLAATVLAPRPFRSATRLCLTNRRRRLAAACRGSGEVAKLPMPMPQAPCRHALASLAQLRHRGPFAWRSCQGCLGEAKPRYPCSLVVSAGPCQRYAGGTSGVAAAVRSGNKALGRRGRRKIAAF
jgi:hypothetical protein